MGESANIAEVPTLAVCGSHQLFAVAADNNFSTSGTWKWNNAVYTVNKKLSGDTHIPSPYTVETLPGEVGIFEIEVTPQNSADPFVEKLNLPPNLNPVYSEYHTMEVAYEPPGASLLFGPRKAQTGKNSKKTTHGVATRVQGLKYGFRQPFYSVQFHPERKTFADDGTDDGGNGQRFVIAYLKHALEWWEKQ